MKQLFKPYGAVLQTYARRRVFWLAGAAMLYHPFAQLTRPVIDLSAENYLTWGLYHSVLLSVLCLAAPVVWMAHLREQLRVSKELVLPGRVLPHLRVGAVVLALYIGMSLVLMLGGEMISWMAQGQGWPHIDWVRQLSFLWASFGPAFGWFGPLVATAVIFTLAAAVCASFGSPWVSLALVPVAFAASTAAKYDLDGVISQLPWTESEQPWLKAFLICIGIPVAAAVALLLVLQVRLAQLSSARAAERSRADARASQSEPEGSSRRPSLMLAPLRERVRYRRSAALSTRAVAVVAAFLAILLVALALGVPLIFPSEIGSASNDAGLQIQDYLILTSVLPATVAALLWRERLPRLAAESLQAVTRKRFITEISLAVLLDVLQYWLAVAVAVITPLALFPDAPVKWSTMLARLGASGLVQVPVFAAILIGLQSRSWPVLIGLAAVAMAVGAGAFVVTPFHVTLQPLDRLLPAAGAIAAVGAAVGAAAYLRWIGANKL